MTHPGIEFYLEKLQQGNNQKHYIHKPSSSVVGIITNGTNMAYKGQEFVMKLLVKALAMGENEHNFHLDSG